MTYWKFDRKEGRIDPRKVLLPRTAPYSQDLSDAGKGPSDGWSFTNSFCSERYVGGIERAVRRMKPAAPPRTPTTCT